MDPSRHRRPDRICCAVVPGGRLVTSWRRSPCPSRGSSSRVRAVVRAALLAFALGAAAAPTPLSAQSVGETSVPNANGASAPTVGSVSAPEASSVSAQNASNVSVQNAGGVLHFPRRPPPPPRKPPPPSNAPMLVQATEIRYDYTNNSVAAVGSVQIYYGGATVEADQVIYDQKTKRLRAEGNVRLTEPDGKITYGQVIDLTDDYRDGFVDSLRLETADDTHFAAARADRARTIRESRRFGRSRPPASFMMRARKCIFSPSS